MVGNAIEGCEEGGKRERMGMLYLAQWGEQMESNAALRQGRVPPSLEAYRTLAELAVMDQVHTALSCDRMDLAFQGVHDAYGRRPMLYQECFASVYDEQGALISADRYQPSLYRTALVGWFDCYVMKRAVDVLQVRPTMSVGVNLSAGSMTNEVYWESLLRQLSSQPEIPRRLILEMTEETALSLEQCSTIQSLKRLGCRVAIDDFGRGTQVDLVVSPGFADLIKIDSEWLDAVNQGRRDSGRLEQLMAVAVSLAKDVVITGVNTERDLLLAREMGGEWVQGGYFDWPPRRLG
ncbi:hypothetical protein C5615_32230 [Burkholderia cepacia]|uniref:EAL domain-containing protein n=1 Tax=Burkholderia cepacia TaxID=292 RepID=A0A2S8IAP1_BURCE|nr:EAL domain-containing protein [Burkholderia cepacia]PQP11432.1 hypothetical protein C5615_32230 [Burkholderia cepacia]HDR9511025.1 EAL domain-containing protein [Burkholderia cepacia]